VCCIGFVQTHFLHQDVQLVGVICSGLTDRTVNTFDQQAFTDESCFIYSLEKEPSILFCQCNIKVQPEQAYSFVDQVELDGSYLSFVTTVLNIICCCDVASCLSSVYF